MAQWRNLQFTRLPGIITETEDAWEAGLSTTAVLRFAYGRDDGEIVPIQMTADES